MKVLVVDDDTLVRYALNGLLEDAGHEVVEATGVNRALEALMPKGIPDGSIQAIVTDCNMPPGMSGLWLLQYLDRSRLQIPCLIHSSDRTFREKGVEFDLQMVDVVFSFARFHLKDNSYSYVTQFLATIQKQ